jgi:hypothetical protein
MAPEEGFFAGEFARDFAERAAGIKATGGQGEGGNFHREIGINKYSICEGSGRRN